MSNKSIFDTGGFIGAEKPYSVPAGEAAFTSPGTFSWTAPEGVTSVCVVCVGGGGGGGTNAADASSGGGGGGLGYKNNITVVPGTAYTVVVGSGGAVLAAGGQSYFNSAATVAGNGGSSGVNGTAAGGAGGTFVGDGGANGGQGGDSSTNDNTNSTPEAGAGGGAGGYSAAGGRGAGAQAAATTGTASTGGGGGGGGSPDSGAAGGGGGVSIFGAGSNGAGGTSGNQGGGGSGGLGSGSGIRTGGLYGGGGAGSDGTTSGAGANGAVRIIWGANRSFPSTNVTENSGDKLYSSGVFSLSSVYDSLSKFHGLTYTYYTQGSTTNPTTEAGLNALFNTATPSPTVTFGGTGTYAETINWGDTSSPSGAGGITKTKPAYLPADNYSWMAEGYIFAPETGTYFFGIDGDDACDIHVSGVNVANSYGGHGFYGTWSGGVSGANTQKSGTITLTAGQYYTFRARMQEGGGGDGVQVGWRKPSDAAIALIPSYFFYRSIG